MPFLLMLRELGQAVCGGIRRKGRLCGFRLAKVSFSMDGVGVGRGEGGRVPGRNSAGAAGGVLRVG